MIHMVNGREVYVPLDPDGTVDSDALREVAAVPKDRTFIQQLPTGENLVVNPGQKIRFNPGAYFRDAPDHVRGREGTCPA